jgi:hypothetical protein
MAVVIDASSNPTQERPAMTGRPVNLLSDRTCSTLACDHLPCFQARVHLTTSARTGQAGAGPLRVADACATHLGDIVESLVQWARLHPQRPDQVTVYATDSAQRARTGNPPQGIAFSIIPVSDGYVTDDG